jgi:hypothetical protein
MARRQGTGLGGLRLEANDKRLLSCQRGYRNVLWIGCQIIPELGYLGQLVGGRQRSKLWDPLNHAGDLSNNFRILQMAEAADLNSSAPERVRLRDRVGTETTASRTVAARLAAVLKRHR